MAISASPSVIALVGNGMEIGGRRVLFVVLGVVR
jgi:hypothetical protein